MKQDLDYLLSERKVPAASADFAARIVSLGAAMPQQSRSPGFYEWLESLFGEFMLPRPAYALASVLLMGLIVGIGIPTNDATAASDDDYQEGGML